jgi:hypothetical protein
MDFGHRIGRGRDAEGVRSASVASISAERRSIGAFGRVFGHAPSPPAVVGAVGRGVSG